jgi:hypothetical protein
MPDDKTKVGEPDRSRVAADQDYEVRQLAEKHGLSLQQNKTAGTWATVVWIGSGLFLYLTTKDASLLSWLALVFFVVGIRSGHYFRRRFLLATARAR